MGLFDFVKDAGEKIFGDDDAPKSVAKSSAAPDNAAADSQATREKVVILVGNSQGVARVDDQMTVEKPEPEATIYTVKSGDSLSKISKTQYGDAMKYMKILEANKPMLKDPDKIYPGQVLRIPPIDG